MACSFVEIGAGKGYLARELGTAGCVVYPYDVEISDPKTMWTEVMVGGPEQILNHTGSVLVLCYPPQKEHPGADMSEKCVRLYKGTNIIYIGEDLDEKDVSSTGTIELAIALREAGFKIVKQLSCVQFPHIFDKMFHYAKN